MRKITAVESVTLDGVMQAPGAREEDTRGGFEQGGWGRAYADPTLFEKRSKNMADTSLLLGRQTYENFYSYWPNASQPNPFTEVLNNTQKYVASTTLAEPLPWMNSTLLSGDAGDAVASLKNEPGNDLVILGSGDLVQSLMERRLIDEFVLSVHPLVLGSGRRLFPDGIAPTTLRLVDSEPTAIGVIIATYGLSD